MYCVNVKMRYHRSRADHLFAAENQRRQHLFVGNKHLDNPPPVMISTCDDINCDRDGSRDMSQDLSHDKRGKRVSK